MSSTQTYDPRKPGRSIPPGHEGWRIVHITVRKEMDDTYSLSIDGPGTRKSFREGFEKPDPKAMKPHTPAHLHEALESACATLGDYAAVHSYGDYHKTYPARRRRRH